MRTHIVTVLIKPSDHPVNPEKEKGVKKWVSPLDS
jgi:hypothetical protein